MIQELVRDGRTYAREWGSVLHWLGLGPLRDRAGLRDYIGRSVAARGQMALDAWLPARPLEALAPGIAEHELALHRAWPGFGNVSPAELMAICLLARHLDARRVLEIGTFDANTAINVALNLPPDGRVHTLDLPVAEQAARAGSEPDWAWRNARPGARRSVPAELAPRVEFLIGDSRDFDFSPFHGAIDLVFIDGSHDYEMVRIDSETATRCVRPGGVVLWHDAAPSKRGVLRALREFGRPGLCRVTGTTLAFWRAPS